MEAPRYTFFIWMDGCEIGEFVSFKQVHLLRSFTRSVSHSPKVASLNAPPPGLCIRRLDCGGRGRNCGWTDGWADALLMASHPSNASAQFVEEETEWEKLSPPSQTAPLAAASLPPPRQGPQCQWDGTQFRRLAWSCPFVRLTDPLSSSALFDFPSVVVSVE